MTQLVRGIHLPDSDMHFAEQIAANPLYRNKGTYQWAKLEAALAECGERREHAVDVGAHVGLWSRVLSYEFRSVTAFEPIPHYGDCFRRNLHLRSRVKLHRIGLGEATGTMRFSLAADGEGSASLTPEGEFEVEVRRLDDMLLEPVDLLKVDCEGAELGVIRGGERMIRRDKPVVIIEQKIKRVAAHGYPRMGAVDLLLSWGAALKWSIKGDHCLAWPA